MKSLLLTLAGFIFALNLHAQDTKSLADSNNAFAFDLYSQINTGSSSNLFFSPFSISSALAMTYAGARNETEKEMSHTLHFSLDQQNFNTSFKALLETIESDNTKSIQLSIANSLWAQKDYQFMPEYFSLVKSDYHSELQKVNFKSIVEREKIRNNINSWVEQKTNSKIKNLIAPNVLDSLTRLVLVNAIYFYGKWENEFDKTLTKDDFFHTSAQEKVKAKFMQSRKGYNYYHDNNVDALEVPYKDDKVSMVIILPKETSNLKSAEASFTNAYYKKIISSLRNRDVYLSLPKFKTSAQFELSNILANMGMPLAFTDNAYFTGIAIALKISHIIHKAYVAVSEEGTEAAAATGVVMVECTSVKPPPIEFNVNHPFIFIIKDNATASILFMGEIKDPTKE